MISHKWLYLADIFEHQIMLMNNLRNFPPVTLGIFQSTLLQEERHTTTNSQLWIIIFQSTLLQAERHKISKAYASTIQFQSTLLQEERRGLKEKYHERLLFQSTLLQEERLSFKAIANLFNNFNPRSYKRSDTAQCIRINAEGISIHAPTRGATCKDLFIKSLTQISIHAPTRGATSVRHRFLRLRNDFNPRSYKRSDPLWESAFCRDHNFNPRSYKRSDSKNAQ